ncbi:hypothetical protein DOJK_00883 [Patescibacteria group bacterium]|nr:hypothetical protein DOJK_00883 [Patescibacteria group bacterium]
MLKNTELSPLDRIRKLKEYFDNGLIPKLAIHEVHPNLPKNDRINYIYFTLPVSINFQRSSPSMWQSALQTFNDPDTNYLFYPEKVIEKSREEIMNDLIKHKLGLQRNKHTDIWIGISTTLFNKYNSDPRLIIEAGNNSADLIINLLQGNKKDFPFLNGLKLSNYWLYILSKFTDIQLLNPHKISIIPDTHIIKSTIHLGFANENVTSAQVEKIWQVLLQDSDISPVEMHPVLWNWSRNNFVPEV